MYSTIEATVVKDIGSVTVVHPQSVIQAMHHYACESSSSSILNFFTHHFQSMFLQTKVRITTAMLLFPTRMQLAAQVFLTVPGCARPPYGQVCILQAKPDPALPGRHQACTTVHGGAAAEAEQLHVNVHSSHGTIKFHPTAAWKAQRG
jgi:hypothetical protein